MSLHPQLNRCLWSCCGQCCFSCALILSRMGALSTHRTRHSRSRVGRLSATLGRGLHCGSIRLLRMDFGLERAQVCCAHSFSFSSFQSALLVQPQYQLLYRLISPVPGWTSLHLFQIRFLIFYPTLLSAEMPLLLGALQNPQTYMMTLSSGTVTY